ncbi:MAG: glycosyltransferase family 4 protein [Deltaproteobacteria bacterium]|nr:glycosyltransferase family 4 protein [Deltaproteobacteria bacterium]
MIILFVSDVSISKVIGGAERVLYEQSTRLARKGHSVHILTRRLPEHDSDHELIQKVAEWRYCVDLRNPLAFLRSTQQNSRELFEKLQQEHPFDRINFHQPFSALGVIQSPKGRSINKIYTCHSLSSEEYISRNPKPQTLLERMQYHLNVQGRRLIEKKVLDRANMIITLSAFTIEKLRRAYGLEPDNMVVIPGGVDLERFTPAVDRLQIRRRLNIPTDKFILFSVRNLVSRMGLDRLIRAFKAVVLKIPNVYLVLGGTGPLKESLVELSREMGLEHHIHFTGFISEEALPDYYRSADVFILPTLELEGFGLVTLEALACGTPVLGTPVGGTQEILSRFDGRFLFQDTSPDAISQLIIDTCRKYRNQPDQWHLDSRRCRSFAEQYYSWDMNVDATEHLFSRNIR